MRKDALTLCARVIANAYSKSSEYVAALEYLVKWISAENEYQSLVQESPILKI